VLTDQASVCFDTGRVEEAQILFAQAIEIAERYGRVEALPRAWANRGDAAMKWDLPEATQDWQTALDLYRRRGDRYNECRCAGSVMDAYLLRGRWPEAEQLALELLEDHDSRPGGANIHCRLCFLHALRGQTDAARASRERAAEWEDSDDADDRALYACAAIAVDLAGGHLDEAVERGLRMLREAISTVGLVNDGVRVGWPHVFEAALRLGRLETARGLVAMLVDQPPGRIPPYLRAQLARGRGLVAAAEGRREAVEGDLTDAIARLRALGYPYWRAIAETDLADWLTAEGRGQEAAPLLDAASATFESLGAAPALARAHSLAGSPSSTAIAT
jgi:tetratricopeptide (TPR) repeat protein